MFPFLFVYCFRLFSTFICITYTRSPSNSYSYSSTHLKLSRSECVRRPNTKWQHYSLFVLRSVRALKPTTGIINYFVGARNVNNTNGKVCDERNFSDGSKHLIRITTHLPLNFNENVFTNVLLYHSQCGEFATKERFGR